MHSSRMRTVRCNGCPGGVSAQGGKCLPGGGDSAHYLAATTLRTVKNKIQLQLVITCEVQFKKHSPVLRLTPNMASFIEHIVLSLTPIATS